MFPAQAERHPRNPQDHRRSRPHLLCRRTARAGAFSGRSHARGDGGDAARGRRRGHAVRHDRGLSAPAGMGLRAPGAHGRIAGLARPGADHERFPAGTRSPGQGAARSGRYGARWKIPAIWAPCRAFGSYEARFVGVASDENGLRPDELRRVLEQAAPKPKFLYLIPNFQNPTGTSPAAARRAEGRGAGRTPSASRWSRTIPYGQLRYGAARHCRRLGALPGAHDWIHLGTFSKILAPGMRLAWTVTPNRRRSTNSLVKGCQAGGGSPHLLFHPAPGLALCPRDRRRWTNISVACAPPMAAAATRYAAGSSRAPSPRRLPLDRGRTAEALPLGRSASGDRHDRS